MTNLKNNQFWRENLKHGISKNGNFAQKNLIIKIDFWRQNSYAEIQENYLKNQKLIQFEKKT